MALRRARLPMLCLGLFSLLLAGCGGPPQVRITQEIQSHLGEAYYQWRAQALHLTVAQTKARDLALADISGPPPEIEAAMAGEAAAIWRDQCSICHGLDGKPPTALAVKPRSWGTVGTRMGFTFGGDKMRVAIYGKIMAGKPPHMPPWRGRLSREQVWALVRHIEGFN